MDRKTL